MESLLIYAITAILMIVIFLPYFFKFRKQQKADISRRAEAESLGIIRPQSQFPMIDQAKCIGCGSCVAACPEDDVLGVVYGKAVIINGIRCVGHGHCEKACPVSAIKVGLGDITTRDDIPITDSYHQSTVEGLYIIGELGGLSLIRNAIRQGRTAIEKISQDPIRVTGGEIKDVIIVGAGPAGLTAALSCIQHKLSYLVLDQQGPGGTILQYPRRKLVMTHPIEIPLYGWLRNTEYTKEQLLDIWEAAIEKFDLEILNHHKVNTVKKEGEIFRVVTEKGDFYAHSVVLAMGRRGIPRKLNVPGEEMPKVMYQLIDAQAYNGNHLLVVGGGDSAVEAAIGLARQKGNKVTISYRKNQFFRIKKKNEERIGRLIKERKIQPVFDSNVLEIAPDAVKLRRHEEVVQIPNEFVFVFAGGIPPFKMMKEMGIRFGGEARAWTQE